MKIIEIKINTKRWILQQLSSIVLREYQKIKKMELEVKILDINKDEFIQKIKSLRAILKKETKQFLYTYDEEFEDTDEEFEEDLEMEEEFEEGADL